MIITHDTTSRRFAVTVDGETAHVAYELRDGALDIRHTIVSEAIGGRGIASELVRTAYDHALQQGLKPVATCSYALAWLKKHPDYHGCASGEYTDGSCAI